MDEALIASRRAELLVRLQSMAEELRQHLGDGVPYQLRSSTSRRISAELAGIYLHMASELLEGKYPHMRSVAVARQKLREAGIEEEKTVMAPVLRLANLANQSSDVHSPDTSDAESRARYLSLVGLFGAYLHIVASVYEDPAVAADGAELRDAAQAIVDEIEARAEAEKVVPLHPEGAA